MGVLNFLKNPTLSVGGGKGVRERWRHKVLTIISLRVEDTPARRCTHVIKLPTFHTVIACLRGFLFREGGKGGRGLTRGDTFLIKACNKYRLSQHFAPIVRDSRKKTLNAGHAYVAQFSNHT